jgi:hypothetical protein
MERYDSFVENFVSLEVRTMLFTLLSLASLHVNSILLFTVCSKA